MLDSLLADLESARALGAIHWEAYVPAVLLLLTGAAMIYLARRPGQKFKVALGCIGALLILRACFFYTPISWYAAFKFYDETEIGFKERGIIAANIQEYFRRSEEPQYLALGSSQIRLFKNVRDRNADFLLYSHAGLMPAEYALYAELIENRKPKNVILYVSEFDLARKPSLPAIQLDPLPFDKIGWLYDQLSGLYDSQKAVATIKPMLIGRLFPEYRYGFLFRPLTSQWFGKPVQQRQSQVTASVVARATAMRTGFDPEYLERNAALVEEFAAICIAHGAKVLIFEGQYHPAAYDEKLNAIRSRSNALLAGIAARHSEVEFFSIEQQPTLTAEDFADAYHVSESSSERFSHALIELAQRRQ